MHITKKIVFTLLIFVFCSTAILSKSLSTPKAALSSLILPGSGQFYAGNNTKGGIFITAELAIIFSYLRFNAEKEWTIDSYKQFAYNKAGVNKNSEDNKYQLIQNYFSSEAYNAEIIRSARNYFLIGNNDEEAYEAYLAENLIDAENAWNWENNKNWRTYQDLREDKQHYELFANFSIAAALLNRLVSVIDTFISTNKPDKQNIGNLSISPDFAKNGMEIKYEYKF